MIASKLARFIKETNIFIQRKIIQAITSAMCIGIHIPPKSTARTGSKQACCTKQTNIFI
jgi:hypothetical protein